MADDEFDARPGRSRDAGARSYRKARTLVGRVMAASRKAGLTPVRRGNAGRGTGRLGRGRRVALRQTRQAFRRRAIIKARVVRHRGTRFRSAPLARHVTYLERDGVTRDGSDGRVFDAGSEMADRHAFAGRCEDDRHHFRFIVSPEDAGEMADLRAFTRELMDDMASDLETRLDWVAIDHWNTDNPHVHVLVRGVADDGRDLVIDRVYISKGLRDRAEERVTAELGPRSERDIRTALKREVDAERWTSLDRRLQSQSDATGHVDLRPGRSRAADDHRRLLIGRAGVLEHMGLARRTAPASWILAPDLEPTLRGLGERGDIIKTIHRAMSAANGARPSSPMTLHEDAAQKVIGRLVARGLHDELTGEAYAIVEGIDGRVHHLRFADLERTSDGSSGAIVETASWTDRRGRPQAGLVVRSDHDLEAQVDARGATWLDRQLVSPNPEALGEAFGELVSEALASRSDVLCERGLAEKTAGKTVFARNLLARLRDDDLAHAGAVLSARYGKAMRRPLPQGEWVSGVYRERIDLASGRFAVIDDGASFQLVPWRQDLDRHLGTAVTGKITDRGGVDWAFARARGPAL